MVLEFTVALPDGENFKEKVTAANESEGRAILEAKYGVGTVPYSCKVISQ
jgi:hypothetical protein